MTNNFFKKNWETIAAIALFLVISCAYFSPSLKGYTLKMSDIQNWSGMSKECKDFKEIYEEEGLWTNTSFSGMPTYQIAHYYTNPLKTVYNAIAKLLTFPIFALFMAFLSFYILAKSFNAGFYIALIGALAYGFSCYNFLILEAGHLTKLIAIAFIPGVIGGMTMIYRRDNWLAPFAVLALFFSLELMANHIQMTYYFAFIMLAIGIAEFIRYTKQSNIKKFLKKSGIIVVALFIGVISNFANYSNTYLFAKETMRGTPKISVNPEGKQAVSTNQTSGLDRDYIVNWCYGKAETWNLLIPTAKGDRTVSQQLFDELSGDPGMYNYVAEQYQKSQGKLFGYYWGDQPFTSGPNYLGAIIVFLALLYLCFVHTTLKWSLLGVSILAILLSWGKNLGGSVEEMWLTNFFIDYIPLYSKFRTVSSILVIINLIAPLMSVLFLTHLANNIDWAKQNFKKIAIVGSVIILIVVYAFSSDAIGYLSQLEETQREVLFNAYMQNPQGVNPYDAFYEVETIRKSITSSDGWRTVGFMVFALGLVLFFIKKENLKKFAFGGIILLVLFDLWNINTRYLGSEKDPKNKKNYLAWEKKNDFSNTYSATPGDMAIYQMESANNPKIQEEANTRIAQLDKKSKRQNRQKSEESIMFSALNFNTNYRVMDLDNPFNSSRVSYFHKSTGGYSPAKLGRYQDMIDFYITNELSFLNNREFGNMKVLNMLNNKYYLYQGQLFAQNPEAYGNAWFVKNVKWVEDNNAEILAIKDTDVKNTAIVHKEFKSVIKSNSNNQPAGSIQMVSYSPMHISYESNSTQDEVAVFSEIYYEDGWNAYMDGKEVPHARANYILRALSIPSGKHTIDFKFEPKMYTIGNIVNLIGFLLLLGSFIVILYEKFIKGKVSSIQQED